MGEGLYLLLALICCIAGMGLLALAMKPHWDQARAPIPYPTARARALRVFGGLALGLSFALCLLADHPSTASLVWLMAVTVSALTVAFTLAYRPRWLGWLVAWIH